MTIDPDQIRAEIDALLASLPDPADAENGPSLAELEGIARRLSEAQRCCWPPWSRRRRVECGVARRARVDAELVRRGLARSRQQAAELIGAGKVRIDGLPAVKPPPPCPTPPR